ncbi:MAG: hypothetical protein JOY77_08595 [Alphaproteobacteria bacterium]|nr:hypothetical protein [Alphaproteobacteria bacterium]
MNRTLHFAALAGVWLASHSALADEASDLAVIRKQLNAMQHEYEAKIRSLETRLARAERDAKAAKTVAQAASQRQTVVATAAPPSAPEQVAQAVPTPAPIDTSAESAPIPEQWSVPPPTPPTSQNAFNPGIAAVLNGFYLAASRDTKNAQIAGFALGDETGLPPRGFSIGESEISFAANIDPQLAGFLDISFDNQNNPNVEEAYITTKDLPAGLTVKAGRFLSGIGYINERHAHDWSFSDAPLPYRAFLGNQYGDDGIQVRWLAPTDWFLEFGAELFRGGAFPAASPAHNRPGTETAFVHTGGDINDSSSWLAALSYLHSSADDRTTDDPLFSGVDHFTGNDEMGILSLVYKWAPGGNPTVQNLVVSGEGFYGREKGLFESVPISQNRNGFYLQGVYQFMPQWSAGVRYAQVNASGVSPLLAGTVLDNFEHSPRAETALLEYDTSEFGRLRLQYTHDDAGLKPNDELLFQYTVIYGPHGAHRY